jgi:tetratricopeptide (TPR) repeat protein
VPTQEQTTPRGRFFAIAAMLLLSGSLLNFANGQQPNVIFRISDSGRKSSNPPPDRSRATSARGGESTKLSSSKAASAAESKKQRIIKDAISVGNKARDQNQYELALASYEKVRTLDPDDERAPYGLGNVYVDLHCNDSAIEAYVNALKLNRKYLEALIGLGYAYAAKERFDDAEAQFRAALDIKSDNVEAKLGLGRIHLLKGKYPEAITQINLVINTPSVEIKGKASAHVVLGDVYWKQEKRKEAIAQFEEAIRLKPDFAWAYVELGNARSSLAFSKVGYFARPAEVTTQELEEMLAIAKQATANLEDARKYGYNHPQIYASLALSLAYRTRYDDAKAKLDEYFAEIKKLEDNLSSNASGCGPGFNRLRADGFWYLGNLSYLQGLVATNAAHKNEFLSKARDYFTESIKLKEDHVSSIYMLGTVYGALEKQEEAIDQYQKALRFTTEDAVKASLFGSIGVAYNAIGKHDDALRNGLEAIRKEPNKGHLYRWLAGTYIGLGRLEDAVAQLKKAEALKSPESPTDDSYYSMGIAYGIRFVNKRNEKDFADAVEALKKMIAFRPKFAGSYDVLGGLYLAKGDATAALENYEKAINLDPKNHNYYINVGRVYSELKNNDDAAIESFRKAIELKPDFAWAYRQLGLLYHRRKNDAEAIKYLESAIRYDSKYLPAYLDLADIYRTQKNYAEAINPLTAAIGVAPKNPAPYRQLGRIYLDSANADEALRNFNRAVEYDSKNAVNHYYLARVYSELKHDDDAAIKHLLTAIQLNPKDPDGYSFLADIHKRRKNYSEAIKLLNTAITNAPNDFRNYRDLAKVYEAQKMNGEAIRYYEEALKRVDAGDSATKTLYLGRIARLQGRYTEAIEYFRKVSYPDTPGQSGYEIGIVYVVSKNKKAAQAEYERLKTLSASLGDDLLRQINEMK